MVQYDILLKILTKKVEHLIYIHVSIYYYVVPFAQESAIEMFAVLIIIDPRLYVGDPSIPGG